MIKKGEIIVSKIKEEVIHQEEAEEEDNPIKINKSKDKHLNMLKKVNNKNHLNNLVKIKRNKKKQQWLLISKRTH